MAGLQRNDSKHVDRTCHGLNVSNGLPCRNAIGPERVDKYCRLHMHQATTTTQDAFSQVQQKLLPLPAEPDTRYAMRTTAILPHASLSSSHCSREQMTASQSSHSLQTNNNQVAPSRLPSSTSKGNLRGYGTTSPQHLYQLPEKSSSHRYDFSSLLSALGCVPKKPKRASRTNLLPAARSMDEEKYANRVVADGVVHSTRTNNQQQVLSPVHTVKRKPVDYSAVLPETTPVVTTPILVQDRQAKIRQDHAEIQAMFAQQPESEPSTLQQQRMPTTITSSSGSPPLDRRYYEGVVNHYMPREEYGHRDKTVLYRMQDAIREALSNPRSSTTPMEKEFIYVLREDGDYQWTPKITLKIGRSKDVEARMRQWYNQCRHKIELLEQVPTVDAVLVERMLHLEFSEDRVYKQCQCGRTHKEWFDIDRTGAKGRIHRALCRWIAFANEVSQ